MLHRDDIEKRLLQLDEAAALMFDDDSLFRIVIVGGSALVLLEYIVRATHDVDALQSPLCLIELMSDYDIDRRVVSYESHFPYYYEDRLVPIDIPSRKIRYFSASLEDIVIAKLHAGRLQDYEDITSDTVLADMNWSLLEQLKNEVKESTLSINCESYKDFLTAYDNYVRGWHQ